jgi:SAM-dependent methyltransferase
VLDIGCGAGSTSFALAARLPDAAVLGVDISPTLVDVAAARATAGEGEGRCRFLLADAARWSDAAVRPDLLFSRHGVMFFDDPVAAFASLHGAAADGAALVFSCFAAPEDNLWLARLAEIVPGADSSPRPGVPGPFGFADADMVAQMLAAAGWQRAQPRKLAFDYVAGSGHTREDAVADAVSFFQRIGPLARALGSLADAERSRTLDALEQVAARHWSNGTVHFPGSAWIWAAHRD